MRNSRIIEFHTSFLLYRRPQIEDAFPFRAIIALIPIQEYQCLRCQWASPGKSTAHLQFDYHSLSLRGAQSGQFSLLAVQEMSH